MHNCSMLMPSPTFTLRGHNVGVTALAQLRGEWLLSGDEEGNIAIWNYHIKKRHAYFSSVANSRIQSLKVVKLLIVGEPRDILVCQSRDDGILLLDITYRTLNSTHLQELAKFPSFPSLFSRGDAVNIEANKAVLVYPSVLAKHLVTIRVVGDDAKTEQSGTAQRFALEPQSTYAVFDLKLKVHPKDSEHWNLYVGYEDGFLCVFSFQKDLLKTAPTLDTEGLDVKLVMKFNFETYDFVSAFDIVNTRDETSVAVCGSPKCFLYFLTSNLDSESGSAPKLETIVLRRPGVTTLCIAPDGQTFALGGWDNVLYYYCMKTRECIGSIKHTKQLQDICFIRNEHTREDDSYEMCCASMHGVILIVPSIHKEFQKDV